MDLVFPKPTEETYPVEVWDLILDKVGSPSDLLNCRKVCKAWAKLLELKKTTFLMPKVFPILYKYLETAEDDEDENEENEAAITTILKMRLVSHGWKESVDGYHQNHPMLNDIGFIELTKEDENYDGEYEPFPLLPYHFIGGEWKSIPKLESFLGKGFSTGSNPLITRYVRYSDSVSNKRQQLRLKTAFKNFLEAFGSHIWTCVLLCTIRAYKNKVDFYRLVGSYLSLMPNLRSLYIQLEDDWKPKTDSKKEELELLLQNEPFPQLQHLTKLEMANLPYPVSVGILANNAHLQKVSLQKWNDSDDGVLPDYIVSVQLHKLKQLALICTEKELFQLPKVSWPIKALSLTIRGNEQVLKNIFQAVSSAFSNTLEHFVVERWYGYDMENNEELAQIRLELPKLRIFKFEIPFVLETIDFLERCTALQEIQLDFEVPHKEEDDEDSSNSSSMDEDEDDSVASSKVEDYSVGSSKVEDDENNAGSSKDEVDNAIIKFKDCITSMNQSNIWQILNKLQFMKIKTNGKEGKVYYFRNKPITFYADKTCKFTRRQFEKFYNAKGQSSGLELVASYHEATEVGSSA